VKNIALDEHGNWVTNAHFATIAAAVAAQAAVAPAAAPPSALVAAEIRAQLKGQVEYLKRKAVEDAEDEYRSIVEAAWGLTYTAGDIKVEVCKRLRKAPEYYSLELTDIISWSKGLIPDAPLMRYNEAAKTEYFDRFFVADLQYVPRDPWLLAQLAKTIRGQRRYCVLGYWD
jgi:hypothetical protein